MIIEFHVPLNNRYDILHELSNRDGISILDNVSSPLFLTRSGDSDKSDPQVIAAKITAKMNATAIITAAVIQLFGVVITRQSSPPETTPPPASPVVITIDNDVSIKIETPAEIAKLPEILDRYKVEQSEKITIKSGQ